jgi:uncharacterized membrane protein YjjB (DUF3815 family)
MIEYISIILLIAIILFTTFDFQFIFSFFQDQYDNTKQIVETIPTMTYITAGLLVVAVILGFLVSLPK